MGKFKDLTGQKFGRLTVIERAEDYVSSKGKKYIQWVCKCDCGNDAIVFGSNLTNNHTQSCGCLNGEVASKNFKKFNKYDLSGEYGIGYTFNGDKFLFDLEDYQKIKDYCWCVNSDGYLLTYLNSKIIRMHRFLTDGQLIDHINGNTLDNRKINLRVANKSKNGMNRYLQSNNTSGVTGVYWNKNLNKWSSHITINRKNIYLGSFDNFDDAVKVRKEAENKYFGEFSYDNSQNYMTNK